MTDEKDEQSEEQKQKDWLKDLVKGVCWEDDELIVFAYRKRGLYEELKESKDYRRNKAEFSQGV